MDFDANITQHPDHAAVAEALGTPYTRNGRTVSAHEMALTIRESRENGVDTSVDRDARGLFLELRDGRGRTYGRYYAVA